MEKLSSEFAHYWEIRKLSLLGLCGFNPIYWC